MGRLITLCDEVVKFHSVIYSIHLVTVEEVIQLCAWSWVQLLVRVSMVV